MMSLMTADQVELVDVEPEDLIKRLNEGKIIQIQAGKESPGKLFSAGIIWWHSGKLPCAVPLTG